MLQAVHPVLPARNVSEALAYYTERLGFQFGFQDTAAAPRYAGVRRDKVELHLQFQFAEDFDSGRAGQASLRIVVDDPDSLFQEWKDRDVYHAHTRVRNTAWGTREFGFFDLNGNGLTFYRDL